MSLFTVIPQGPFESNGRKQLSLSSCGWVLILSGQFIITVDAKIAKIIQNSHFLKKVSLEEQRSPERGPTCEGLGTFLAVMRARYPRLQVRSDTEEALKHVLKHTCGERVHLEYSNTFWKLLHSMVGVKTVNVRAMKEMMQRQKDAVFSLVY